MKKGIIFIISLILLCFGINVSTMGSDNAVSIFFEAVKLEEEKAEIEYVTRGEFVAVLMKMLDSTKDIYVSYFKDVHTNSWEYVYVANAQELKITEGDDGYFYSDRFVTVEEAIAFISRAYNIDAPKKDLSHGYSVSEYASDYIYYAIENGLYPKNKNNLLLPQNYLTLNQAITLIEGYRKIDLEKFTQVELLDGYPRLVESGRSTHMSVLFKANKPCNIYYSINEAVLGENQLTPQNEDIVDFLGNISKENFEVKLSFKGDVTKRYNVYFVAVDTDLNRSRIYSFENISPLPFTIGNGTAKNPYRIYTALQLDQVRYYPDKHFLLCEDIEYNGMWIPIGYSMKEKDVFSGVFDGGGHKISNLSIVGGDNIGFFASISGGKVRNLTVDADCTGENNVGIIAGQLNGGVIEKCHASGMVRATQNIAGGIVGINNGKITNCVSACISVEASGYSGGISGTNSGEIKNTISCVTTIISDLYASGISGANISGIIENSVAASSEVSDMFTKNSGRITTNKSNGICKNNYVFEGMLSGDIVYLGPDTLDGDEVSWEELLNEKFYKEKLEWNFKDIWNFQKSTDFLMPTIKNQDIPIIKPGLTIYHPMAIYDFDGLDSIRKNLSYHYILKNDIIIPNNLNWEPIGVADNFDDYVTKAFCGSFNGNGHSIKNLKITDNPESSQFALFGVLYGGIIRNLNVVGADIYGHSNCAIISAVNYGVIENCRVEGKITTTNKSQENLFGGICAKNYTNIFNSTSNILMNVDSKSATVGGVAGYNEGNIFNSNTFGKIISDTLKLSSSNAVIGKICGVNFSGMIYNCYSDCSILSSSDMSYLGGIAGMQTGGEIYMCASRGSVSLYKKTDDKAVSYVGGIAGLISGGLIMNSYSHDNLSTDAYKSYCGGITGMSENSNLQNSYYYGIINQTAYEKNDNNFKTYTAGISGYSDNANISGCVVLAKLINSNSYIAPICAWANGGYIDNNYYLSDSTYKGIYDDFCVIGNSINSETAKSKDFYFAGFENGGKLMWSYGDDGSWYFNKNFDYPVLIGVMEQDKIK